MTKINLQPLQQEAALWQCPACQSWWCSQPDVQPTNLLLALPGDLLEELGWDNFRGWRLGGTPHVATCPQCASLALHPTFGYAGEGAQLQQDLAKLLQPVLAAT